MKKNKEKPIIYIHVGLAKTGTTAIQNFIVKNKRHFADYNFHYPSTGLANNCHHGIAFYWGDYKAFKKSFKIKKNTLEIFSEELHANKDKNILISSECLNLGEVNWEELLSLFPHKRIKIIVYLRRQDNMWSSAYREMIKNNTTYLPSKIWLESHKVDNYYYERLKHYQQFVDKKDIIIRIYEKEQFIEGSIFSDFCSILSIPIDKRFRIPTKNYNPHLSRGVLEYNRLLNTVYNIETTPYMFNKYLTLYSQRGVLKEAFQFNNNNIFSTKKRNQILNDCKKYNEKIASEYLNRKDGKLFYEPISHNDDSFKEDHTLSDKEILNITRYLYQQSPDLVKQILERLEDAQEKDAYVVEAKNKLIPVLKKVIKIK